MVTKAQFKTDEIVTGGACEVPGRFSSGSGSPGEPFRTETLLTSTLSRGHGCRRRGLAASLLVHVLLLAVLVALPAHEVQEVDGPRPIDVVFYTPPSTADDAVPPAVAPEPPSAPEQEIGIDEPPVRIVPPFPTAVPARISPQPPSTRRSRGPIEPLPPRPVDVQEPAVRKPPRSGPAVRTNVFPESAPPPDATPPAARQARTGVFTTTASEAAAGHPRSANPAGARTGTFDAASGASTGGGPRVSEGEGREVARVRFDVVVASAEAPGAGAKGSGSVRRGRFGDAVPVAEPQNRRRRPVARPDAPVEILSKPKPIYTEEARRLRVEGEVVLEVLFGASGQLRVLRVLRSLGHGLDEAAVEAARRIHFKAARRGGRPIDHTATLRVVFQLA